MFTEYACYGCTLFLETHYDMYCMYFRYNVLAVCKTAFGISQTDFLSLFLFWLFEELVHWLSFDHLSEVTCGLFLASFGLCMFMTRVMLCRGML